AWADPYTGPAGQTPKLTPTGFTSPSSNHAFTDTNGAQVLGETFTRTANGGFLARTGADILGTAAVGVFCVGLGVVLVRRSRRHRVPPSRWRRPCRRGRRPRRGRPRTRTGKGARRRRRGGAGRARPSPARWGR